MKKGNRINIYKYSKTWKKMKCIGKIWFNKNTDYEELNRKILDISENIIPN